MKHAFTALLAFSLVGLMPAQSQGLEPFKGESHYDNSGRLTYISISSDQHIRKEKVQEFVNTILLKDGIGRVVAEKTERDDLGFEHIRFNITVNGIVVANKVIFAHLKNNRLVALNGDLSSLAAPVNGFNMSEAQALGSALNHIAAESYKWEDKSGEQHMREVMNDPSFTYYPSGKKVAIEHNGTLMNAWKFVIYADMPLYGAEVYVDAASGKILFENNLICTADVPGTAATKYSGTRAITCDNTGGNNHRLRETGRGLGVETYNKNYNTNFSNVTDFTNNSPNWNLTGLDQGALDAHWGAETTYDYLWSQHNRNSIDNAGFKLISYVHHGTNYANAFWNGQYMTYGDGNSSYGIFTTLDICGHEITHGLTSKTANLTYSYESGALNESYSDIFGTAIERYGRPGNWNWNIGEDLNNSMLRSMSNPNQRWQPDTYLGTYWYTGTGDNGGVHTNSGVSNFWFYLLSTGGSGTNDISQAYSVSSIGVDKAAKIAFRALTVYFTPSTNFANARLLTIQAAKDLYGDCSNEVIQTANAWHAVGVGVQYSAANTAANFYAFSTNHCALPATVSFSNTTVNGQSFFWDFGDGATATTTNAAHTYTAAGNYNVKLKVNGCTGADSAYRQAYVTIGVPSMPSVSDVVGCVNGTVALNASGNASILWYESAASPTAVSLGSQYITPSLPASTTYYVSNTFTTTTSTGGMSSTAGGTYLNNNGQYLIFDVYQNSILNSIVVVAQMDGNRTFQLRDAGNNILTSLTVSLTAGTNTVPLNFVLNPGLNYRLGLNSSSYSSLQRTFTGVNFPYQVGPSVKITSSSGGDSNYMFFYDWDVSISGCSSPRIPVNILLHQIPGVLVSVNNTLVCVDEEVELDLYPPGGVLSGNAVSGSNFIASVSGPGLHQVDYLYTDENGCSNTSSIILEVDLCTGLENSTYTDEISVYPNPARDAIIVKSGFAGQGSLSIADASGRIVYIGRIDSDEERVSMQGLSRGLYILTVNDPSGVVKTLKIIKE